LGVAYPQIFLMGFGHPRSPWGWFGHPMGKPSNWYGGGGTTPLALNHPQWPKPINFNFFFFFYYLFFSAMWWLNHHLWGGSATPDSATPLAKMGVAGHPYGGQGGWVNHPFFFFPFFNSFLFFSTFILLLF
jgi:hypothetical protein